VSAFDFADEKAFDDPDNGDGGHGILGEFGFQSFDASHGFLQRFD
jgi:hypothetical protein